MQCIDVGGHSVCCGRPPPIKQSDDVLPMTGVNQPDEKTEPIETSNEVFGAQSLECPEPAFTILSSDGDPLQCDEDCAHHVRFFTKFSLR